MTVAHEESMPWRSSMEDRVAKLEAANEKCAFAHRESRGLIAAVDADMSAVHAEFRAQRGMLQALHLTQQDQTARLVRLETDVTGLRADVTGLKADVTGLRADVTGLQADVTGLQADVTGLRADVTGLKADVTGLQAGQATVLAGVQTIIGLLTPADNDS